MKKAKITLLASFAIILSTLYLNLAHKHDPAQAISASVTVTDDHPALEATIQILLFPAEALDELGIGQNPASLREALSRTDFEYRYELGLGTLVSHNGEFILITHDHWGPLDTLGAVQFRNAAGDPLVELDGETFKDLIRYQDGGTLILGRHIGGDRSNYLSALVSISQAKYNRRIIPAELGGDEPINEGKTLIIVRQGRNGSNGVELMEVSVESIEERWGQPVYRLRSGNGKNVMPGDSGGGLWLGGCFVGNLWKSEFTYGWNWETLELEQEWTETSYATGLPDLGEQVIQSLRIIEIIDEVDYQTSGGDF